MFLGLSRVPRIGEASEESHNTGLSLMCASHSKHKRLDCYRCGVNKALDSTKGPHLDIRSLLYKPVNSVREQGGKAMGETSASHAPGFLRRRECMDMRIDGDRFKLWSVQRCQPQKAAAHHGHVRTQRYPEYHVCRCKSQVQHCEISPTFEVMSTR